MEEISIDKISNYSDKALELVTNYAPKVLMAIVTLIIGLFIIKLITNGLKKLFARQNYDVTLQGFLVSLLGMVLKVLLGITVISMLGVQMTSFIALLGAAGLAVGMALSGTLQNFAGGVMLLLFRPYKVGDLVETQGHTGVVKEIQIFNTVLNTPDGKTVIVPNSPISTNSLVNFTAQGTLRVDLSVGIGYEDNIKKAKDIILNVLNNDERILKDPAAFVGVESLGDSSVNLVVRPWTSTAHYWDVYFDTNEAVKNALDENGISIPFPQQDVNMKQA